MARDSSGRDMAVSPGVVTGRVKMLRDPHEKPVNKGDVLVAGYNMVSRELEPVKALIPLIRSRLLFPSLVEFTLRQVHYLVV